MSLKHGIVSPKMYNIVVRPTVKQLFGVALKCNEHCDLYLEPF